MARGAVHEGDVHRMAVHLADDPIGQTETEEVAIKAQARFRIRCAEHHVTEALRARHERGMDVP
jgi:hypothetical protein